MREAPYLHDILIQRFDGKAGVLDKGLEKRMKKLAYYFLNLRG
jgi:hypothetical protein